MSSGSICLQSCVSQLFGVYGAATWVYSIHTYIISIYIYIYISYHIISYYIILFYIISYYIILVYFILYYIYIIYIYNISIYKQDSIARPIIPAHSTLHFAGVYLLAPFAAALATGPCALAAARRQRCAGTVQLSSRTLVKGHPSLVEVLNYKRIMLSSQ